MVFFICLFIAIKFIVPTLGFEGWFDIFLACLMALIADVGVWLTRAFASTNLDLDEAISFKTFQKNNSHLNIVGALLKYILKYWFSLCIIFTWGLQWIIKNVFYKK